MRERFVNEFLTKIEGKITDDDLKIVYQQLTIFVGEYEISPRNTEVVLYEGYSSWNAIRFSLLPGRLKA